MRCSASASQGSIARRSSSQAAASSAQHPSVHPSSAALRVTWSLVAASSRSTRGRSSALDQREVDGGSGRMERHVSQVLEREQRALVVVGKEPLGGVAGTAVASPVRHGADGAARAITVVDLEPEPGRLEVGVDAFQRRSDLALENAFARLVTVERPPDEIVGRGVTDVLGNGRIDVAQVDHAVRQLVLRRHRPKSQCKRRPDTARPGEDAAHRRPLPAAAETALGLLRDEEFIVGIKDSSGRLENLVTFADARDGHKWTLLVGDDP